MARGQDSSVAFRVLGPRATALGSGDGDALQNIGTGELPDGASCFVTDIRANYRWNPTSVTAPSGTDVVAPFGNAAVPGRWFNESVLGGLTGALHMCIEFDVEDVGPTVTVVSDLWHRTPVVTALYHDITPGTPSPKWSMDPDTGVITYNGAGGEMFKMSVGASLTCVATPDVLLDLTISVNDGLLGTADNSFPGSQAYAPDTTPDQDTHVLTEGLFIPETGDSFRPIVRIQQNSGDIRVNRLNFVIIPV